MNKDAFLTVRLTAEDYSRFKAMAEENDTSVSNIVRQGVREMLALYNHEGVTE